MTRVTYRQTDQAASTRVNIFNGDSNEFLSYPARIDLYIKSSVIPGITVTALADQDVAIDDKPLVNAAGTSLVIPDDYFGSFEVEADTRVAVFIREATGVSTTDWIAIADITPL